MFSFNSLIKKKESPTVERPFAIDLERLDSCSFEKLKDYVLSYEKFCEKTTSEVLKLRSENAQLTEDRQRLEEHVRSISELNVELGSKATEQEQRRDFGEVLQQSLARVTEGLGSGRLAGVGSAAQALRESVAGLTVALKAGQARLAGEEGADRTAFLQSVEALLQELAQQLRPLHQRLDTVEGLYDSLLKDFQKLYYSMTDQDEPEILERFMLTDLVVCSKRRLAADARLSAGLRKDLALAKSEQSVLLRRLEKAEREAGGLRNRNQELELKTAELCQGLDSVSQLKNAHEAELATHLEMLKLLQRENYTLNMSLQELRAKTADGERLLLALRREKQELGEQLREAEASGVSGLRQERLRLEQSRRDAEQLEEKLREAEAMLRSENLKYEELYRKYKESKDERRRGSEAEAEPVRKSPEASSVNESGSARAGRTVDYGGARSRPACACERLAEELDELRLALMTAEVQLATERRVFDELNQQGRDEIRVLGEQGAALRSQVAQLQKSAKTAKTEITRLNSLIEDLEVSNTGRREESLLFNETLNNSLSILGNDSSLVMSRESSLMKLAAESPQAQTDLK